MTDSVIHDAIQEQLSLDDGLGACFVTAWVAVVEVVGDDGRRWLVNLDSGSAEDPLPEWTRNGLLYQALHHPDAFETEEDEDE